MLLPAEFSKDSEKILKELSFRLTKSNDAGMRKVYEWTNELMKLILVYDRGYYECFLLPDKKPFENLSLIKLLRYIKNDNIFYQKELVDADLSYTLPINDYLALFYKYYNLVKEFLETYDQEAFDRFNKYKVHYHGI